VARFISLRARDIRFPTSRQLDGSDAMNPDPDYSAAYVTLHTDAGDGLVGHGFTFTIGRGNELCVAACESLAPLIVGLDVESVLRQPGAFWRHLTGDSQLRWVGPEKGVIHLATAAVVNAVWDLHARRAGKPLWLLLSQMSPEQIIEMVDFRYISDALTPDDAHAILDRQVATRVERVAYLREHGYPGYTTSAGWLGYPDDKLRRLCREAMASGWTAIKIKVGDNLDDDVRRARIARDEIGRHHALMLDANQRWDVDEAIASMGRLGEFEPLWIEEPTSPDDVLGHARIAAAIAPIGVATGEMVQNRVIFKQLMQAGGIAFCQLDAARLGGVNEAVAVMLLAAKFGIPVCPHAGGVGLCEYVQHLSIFDYVAVSGVLEGRMIEYVDHLHEHFVDPVVVRNGRYLVPDRPGYSAEIRADSLDRHEYPGGEIWQNRA